MTSLHEERLFMVYMAGRYYHVFTPRNGTVADLCAAVQKKRVDSNINFGGLEIRTMMLVENKCDLVLTDALVDAILDHQLVVPKFH